MQGIPVSSSLLIPSVVSSSAAELSNLVVCGCVIAVLLSVHIVPIEAHSNSDVILALHFPSVSFVLLTEDMNFAKSS